MAITAGDRIGRLTIIERIGEDARVECECGTVKVVRATNLAMGRTRSCGCLRRDRAAALAMPRPRAIGMSPEYVAWNNMIARCHHEDNPQWHNYGGRGITVCDEWRKSFDRFLEDVGMRPTPDHSIERIENDSIYEKSNVRWATRREQGANRRNNRHVTIDGHRLTVTQACDRYRVVSPTTACHRLAKGWSDEAALLQPTSPRATPVTVDGVTYPSRREAARAYGLLPHTVESRVLQHGMSLEQALTTPLRGHARRVDRVIHDVLSPWVMG